MIVASIRGGLGNQLFMYAFSRALALHHGVPLALDVTTGFRHDYFRRKCELLKFAVTSRETSAPVNFKICHLLSKLPAASSLLGLAGGKLIVQTSPPFDFDPLAVSHSARAVRGNRYVFGYWQNEKYFAPHAATLRQEFKLTEPVDEKNLALAQKISAANAVCLHARRLHGAPAGTNKVDQRKFGHLRGLPVEYYRFCLQRIREKLPSAHLFCFSDDPGWILRELRPDFPMTVIDHNLADDRGYMDLWLMSLCKHFILANSTFSWWGAWLAQHAGKTVYCPDPREYFGFAEPAPGWQVVRDRDLRLHPSS